jgi:hypothetical protein
MVGDARSRLAELTDDSVDLVLTSPPFLSLRSYLPDDHPDKALEVGAEPDPATFITTLLELTADLDRVLAPHGSIALELGDTYSGSGGAGGDYTADGMRAGQAVWSGSAAKRRRNGEPDNDRPPRRGRAQTIAVNRGTDPPAEVIPDQHRRSANQRDQIPGWPLDKSLAMIPELYRVALAYGVHPLTGDPSPAGRWRVRNVVRWHRPNPTPGELGDKYRPATTDLVIACRSKTRWFDLDAVRHDNPRKHEIPTTGGHEQARADVGLSSQDSVGQPAPQNQEGAPPLDTWVIGTAPYRGSHYATWPPELCRIPVESMCPRDVCRTCGEPRRRIVASTRVRTADGTPDPPRVPPTRADAGGTTAIGVRHAVTTTHETLGWSDCGHGDYRPGAVLDPFAGTGTTLLVATGRGRNAVGFDLDERNVELARERIGGLFLEVVDRE